MSAALSFAPLLMQVGTPIKLAMQRLWLGGRGTAVLAASSPGVILDGDTVAVPAATFAVIEV